MKFKKIKIKNIRSYKNEEIEFPEGSLLLTGDIGAGKTSILLAMEYALFGLQPGQKGSSLLRNNESAGEVALEFEVSGKNVVIERKLKRTSKGVSNEYAALTINGEKKESSVTEVKSKIVELLGYPPEFVKKNNLLFRFTVYTAQEQMKEIILEDAETRVNILRHVFGVDKYRQIKNNLNILLSNIKSESKVIQGEISYLEQDKENLSARKSNLSIITEKIAQKKSELLFKTKNREIIDEELKELHKKIEDKKSFEREIEKTKILLSTKRENLSSLIREEKEIEKSLAESPEVFSESEMNLVLEELRKARSDLESLNSQRMGLIAKSNLLEKEAQDTASKKDRIFKIEICPTCLQNVSEVYKHNILNETEKKLVDIKSSLELLQDEIRVAVEKISLRKIEVSKIEDRKIKLEIIKSKTELLEKYRSKLFETRKQKQNIENDLVMLTKHIDKLKESVFAYSPFENQLKKKEIELRQANLEEKEVEISLAELERELQISKKEILLLEEFILRKENSKKKLQELSELLDWLSTHFLKLVDLIERNVLLKLRKEFSEMFRKWFLVLVPENSLDSQIDENFTPIIIQGETEMDYSFLSGGERTAVALAYRLALNQTINSLLSKIKTRGLIILDEPTDGFSEAQIMKVRDILEELNAEQLIIVSHEQKIESFVDSVLKISKDGDCSVISSSATGNVNYQKT